jgi:carbon-monoxide dehydrogenase small subunit
MVNLNVNGTARSFDGDDDMPLLWYLRDELRLTGTRFGCGAGLCGACTVHVDGRAVKSCTMFAVQADGRAVTTIEALGEADALHPLQTGFWEEHGLQCGYCTPGMILSAAELLAANPSPTDAEIRHAIEGNICRCTGYQQIVNAIQHAAKLTREARR